MRWRHLIWPALLWACDPRVELGMVPGETTLHEQAQLRERMQGRWRGTAKLYPLEWELELDMVFEGDAYRVECAHPESSAPMAWCPSFGDSGTYTWVGWDAPGVASLRATEAVMLDGQHVTDATISLDSVSLDPVAQRLSFWRIWEAPRQPFRDLAGRQLQALLEFLLGQGPTAPDAGAPDAGRPDAGGDGELAGSAADAGMPDDEASYTTVSQVVLHRVP